MEYLYKGHAWGQVLPHSQLGKPGILANGEDTLEKALLLQNSYYFDLKPPLIKFHSFYLLLYLFGLN